MAPHAPRREELERGQAQLCVSPGLGTVQMCGSRFGGKGSPAEDTDAVVNVLRKEAWDLVEGEQYEAAIGKFTAAIEIQPSNAALFASRAYARLELGLVDAAVEDCETGISIAPGICKGAGEGAVSRFCAHATVQANLNRGSIVFCCFLCMHCCSTTCSARA